MHLHCYTGAYWRFTQGRCTIGVLKYAKKDFLCIPWLLLCTPWKIPLNSKKIRSFVYFNNLICILVSEFFFVINGPKYPWGWPNKNIYPVIFPVLKCPLSLYIYKKNHMSISALCKTWKIAQFINKNKILNLIQRKCTWNLH